MKKISSLSFYKIFYSFVLLFFSFVFIKSAGEQSATTIILEQIDKKNQEFLHRSDAFEKIINNQLKKMKLKKSTTLNNKQIENLKILNQGLDLFISKIQKTIIINNNEHEVALVRDVLNKKEEILKRLKQRVSNMLWWNTGKLGWVKYGYDWVKWGLGTCTWLGLGALGTYLIYSCYNLGVVNILSSIPKVLYETVAKQAELQKEEAVWGLENYGWPAIKEYFGYLKDAVKFKLW